MSSTPFCPCKDMTCRFNPQNHDKGCNLCIEDSLACREIPKCFFLKTIDNIDEFTDWSFEHFAELVLKKQ